MKTSVHFLSHLAQFFLELDVSDKSCSKNKAMPFMR